MFSLMQRLIKSKEMITHPEEKLPAPVELGAILSQYDLKKVERSTFDYFQAVRSVADKMLDALDNILIYEAAYPEDFPIFESSSNDLYYDSIAERQKIITPLFEQLFNRSVDGARRRLLALKNDAVSSAARFEEAATIGKLTALENEPRVDFNLVVEKCVRMVNDALLFERHRKFIVCVVEEYSQWSRTYGRFERSMHRTDDVWHDSFLKWRLEVERMLLPLLEHGFENGAMLTDETMRTVERGLTILKAYRDELQSVYDELEGVKMPYYKKVNAAQGKLSAINERCWQRLEDALIGSDRREQMFLVRWMGELIE